MSNCPHPRGDCGGRSVAAEGALVPSHISSGDFTFQDGQTPRKELAGVHTSALTQRGLSSAVPSNSLLSFSHDVVAAGNGMPPSVSPASSEKKKVLGTSGGGGSVEGTLNSANRSDQGPTGTSVKGNTKPLVPQQHVTKCQLTPNDAAASGLLVSPRLKHPVMKKIRCARPLVLLDNRVNG
ncbi:hypothetical protein TcYC6_0021570 [Trypanosoma cruzi]|nr:hypothetical protein TcYC6_0021570 [Trypanosoma cruzi]